MAPIFQSAALCFMALCGLKSAHAAGGGGGSAASPTPVAAGDDVYLALNLARRGRLAVRLNALTKQQTLVDSLLKSIPTTVGNDCGKIDSVTSQTASGFVATFTTEPNYKKLVQDALSAALKKMTKYPTDDKFNVAPWTDAEVANILHVLSSASTEVGCAVTTKCASKQLLVCQMNPKLGTGAPFSEEFFKALQSRSDSIEDMTEADLKTGSNSGIVAVPSVLFAGLVAMLATAAA
ncbi:SAG family member [Eimeria tenella]|uniref:SAG family member n=1 Tax=Eimeria tenella TaxID=5802 RepID=U6KHG0_EIMTE|nr:SAG family member [Eimeria tenella]CDJ37354.1 SAG family member [Eimeria tenella]|eukprot:XP_013228192.1 SAG family member [Eimeria tenella]